VRRLAVLAAAVALAGLAAGTAMATNECRGLQVCVPVAGPWVVAAPARVEYQLSCPKNFIVAGLDAELTTRKIEVGFVGNLGSPVNPGITTTGAAVFLGRLAGAASGASFRPHIGCIPAAGGGQRAPTAYHPFPPGKPTTRQVVDLHVRPGATTRRASCARNERLVAATYALGFPGDTPPSVEEIAAVRVTQRSRGGVVVLTARSAARTRAVVQLDLVCGAR
jgi:hypothetical protein